MATQTVSIPLGGSAFGDAPLGGGFGFTTNIVDTPPTDEPLSIGGWVRYLLTGDPDTAMPSDAMLSPILQSVAAQVQRQYPCLVSAPQSDEDIAAYQEYVGHLVAIRYVGSSPVGAAFTASVTSVDLDPVTLKTSSGMNAATFTQSWQDAANAARNRISCIAESLANYVPPPVSMFGVAGHRRNLERRCRGYR